MKNVGFWSGVIYLMLCIVCPLVLGDVITTSSDTSYTQGEEKVITLAVPANCSAFYGEIVMSSNCTLVSITENYATKEIHTEGNKFILYGLNQDVMTGENLLLTVNITNNSEAFIGIANPLGSTPDALPITVDVFNHVMTSGYDLNGDGVTNADDVTFAIDKIYDGDLTVTDLQAIINAAIGEM